MVRKSVLDNGVRVVSDEIDCVHSVSVGIWVKVGSRHENSGEAGIAHFIEHMLFKGTPLYSAADIARIIDSIGGVINAFTTKEYTCFYFKVLKQHFDLAFNLMCEIYFNSVFDPGEIAKEQHVVLQEISMTKDTPDDHIHDIYSEVFFRSHPLNRSVLGDSRTVLSINRDSLTDYFNAAYFVPERLIVTAAGNIPHSLFLDRVEKKFSHIKSTLTVADYSEFTPVKNVRFSTKELEQVHICFGVPGISHCDQRRYPLFMLNAILGGSMSSRLFQEIRENRGLAYSIFSFASSFYDTGLFGVYMGVTKENALEAVETTLAQIDRIKQSVVAEAELLCAKEQLKGNMLMSLESSDSRMSRVAKCEIYYNDFIPVEEVIANIDNVRQEDVAQLALDLFNEDISTFIFMGPVSETDMGIKSV